MKINQLFFTHYIFLGVFLWSKQNDKTFWNKYTENQPKTRGQYGKDLDSYSELSRGTDICWDKSDQNISRLNVISLAGQCVVTIKTIKDIESILLSIDRIR